jgi:prepilin-type N-terminal cleavage/methylation domain-containing protein
MRKLKKRHNNKGFTIVELAITIFIIAILSGIGLVGLSKLMATNRQTQCVNNLREISQGLQFYHNDLRTFPDDGYPYDKIKDPSPLSTELASYIKTKSIFVCPEDEDTTSISNFASYDPYYVARPGSYQSEELVIGCPRHSNASTSTSLFSMGSTEITDIDTVLANGQEIPPDGTKAQRTISNNNDVMTFADGSTVEITNSSGGDYGCFLVQSVRLADGTLYSIVRVQDEGTIDVNVTTGSKFEIVTPSAIVGVRGTQFTVQTSNGGNRTDVNLTEGTVILMNRNTGETTTLTIGGTTVASAVVNMHSHSHWHADGTHHNHDHPNLNLVHHGNSALAMKVASGAGGGGDDQGDDDDQAHIDYINDPGNTSSEVRDYCLANYPLSDDMLLSVINRDPLLDGWGNYDILIQYNDLSENVLNAMINEDQLLISIDFHDVLINNSPLPQSIVDQITAGKPTTMMNGHRNAVLSAQ